LFAALLRTSFSYYKELPFAALQRLQRKMLKSNRQKLRAKQGAKPFDACQPPWTKMDKIFVASALQLHEATSQDG
jgi:hypothetical protein